MSVTGIPNIGFSLTPKNEPRLCPNQERIDSDSEESPQDQRVAANAQHVVEGGDAKLSTSRSVSIEPLEEEIVEFFPVSDDPNIFCVNCQ